MIGNMLHRLPAIQRPVDRQSDGGPNHPSLFRCLSDVELSCYRRVALRGYRLLWIAAAPFYVVAMLINLVWACLWMPNLESDTDADSLGWESDALIASQFATKHADALVVSSKPSMN